VPQCGHAEMFATITLSIMLTFSNLSQIRTPTCQNLWVLWLNSYFMIGDGFHDWISSLSNLIVF